MYKAPEEFVALNRANMEVAMRFAGVALEGAERLIDLQLRATKSLFADSIESAKALGAVKDLQELATLKETLAQPALDKATAYAKSVYDVATETQTEFSKLVEEQVAEYQRQVTTTLDKIVKTAPAGSEAGIAAVKSALSAVNSAYDNLSKVGKQVAEATQSNFEAAAKQTANEARKATKKAA